MYSKRFLYINILPIHSILHWDMPILPLGLNLVEASIYGGQVNYIFWENINNYTYPSFTDSALLIPDYENRL